MKMAEMKRVPAILVALICLFLADFAQARTVYRCVRGNTVSLATAPEPGSKCVAKEIDDNAAKVPNLWGDLGAINGTLYEREQDGKTVYSTRNLPGSTPVLKFFVQTPPGSSAHEGLGKISKPRLDMYAKEFKSAAKKTKIDDAFLRAIAHAESGFDERATSSKGAQGVMQLMPETSRELGVADPYAHEQSITGGARLLQKLLSLYKGDYDRAAAAYNAGTGAVAKYGGIPPYRETVDYVQKVNALHAAYRTAMKLPPLQPILRAAQ